MDEGPLQLSLALDRTSLSPGDRSAANLVVTLRAGGRSTTPPVLTVVLVLDFSASMRGPPLEHLIQSVERLVSLLTPIDQIAVVTFSHSAGLAVSPRPANADTKRLVQATLRALEASASTNMEAGLRLGLEVMPKRRENERQVVMLLSDGAPNTGLCTPLTLAELVKATRSQISVWTLGYGIHHQEDILTAISSAGGGRYESIPEPQVCELAFARVLGAQGLIVADAVQLILRPAPGVEVTRVLGKHELRYSPGGLDFHIPDVFAGSERVIVAELALSPSAHASAWRVMSAALAYRAMETLELRSALLELCVPVSDAGPATGASAVEDAKAGVLLARSDEARAEARALADRGHFDAAAAVLGEMLRAIESSPFFSPFDGSPLADAREVLRDELMVMEERPKAEAYKAFRRSQLNVSVSLRDHAIPPAGAHDNVYANEIMRAVAGDYPAASLAQLSGHEHGRRLPLHGEQIIGRAQTAQIVVADPRVTRHHTRIIAQRGRFFAIDLGSANGTWLNGSRIESHVLAPGDLLSVAEVKFLYEEGQTNAEPRLMALAGDGNAHVVEKDRLFVIGSSTACTMVIDSPDVGRQHAAVRYHEGGYYLEDYGSSGGSHRPDGTRITERVRIQDGDEVRMGGRTVKFVFRR